MARLEEWKPTVCEKADGNAGLDRLQLASKRHLQRVSKSGLLKKFLVEEQNGISIKWDFLNFVIFIEQNGIPFVREGTVHLLERKQISQDNYIGFVVLANIENTP